MKKFTATFFMFGVWLLFFGQMAMAQQSPYNGVISLPGTVEAEDFDNGGEGVAYHDNSSGNEGGAYRSTGVDIETSSEGGYNVGWMESGEWLEYTVNVSTAGAYTIELRVATQQTGGTYEVSFSNGNVSTGDISFSGTGGYQTYTTASKTGVQLNAGEQVMRLNVNSFYSNISYINVVSEGGSGGGGSVSGTVSQETWTGINGTAISDIPLTTTPSSVTTLTSLEIPTNSSDNYGVRIKGYVVPSTSGDYTFYLASDDAGEFWLSSNDQPGNTSRIAYHTAWTNSREWGKYGTQQSSVQNLTAGNYYYFEALMKEGGGGDNLAVGWTGPGISNITVIGSDNLSTYEDNSSGNDAPSISITNPSQGAAFTAGNSIDITADASDADGSISNVIFWYIDSADEWVWINEDNSAPYTATWSSIPEGNYTILARAIDNDEVSTDATVDVTINSSGGGSGGNDELTVNARGTSGEEQLDLKLDDVVVQTWTLITNAAVYTYIGDVSGKNVKLEFTNDGASNDVQIDYVVLNGTTYQAENQVINTGVWTGSQCGGEPSDWLHCAGYIDFGSIDGSGGDGGGGSGGNTPSGTKVNYIGTNLWYMWSLDSQTDPNVWTGAHVWKTANPDFANDPNPWNPNFIQNMKVYSNIRFMDWNATNNSDNVNWTDRTRKSDPLQATTTSGDLENDQGDGRFTAGVAYEWMMDLCNRVDADMWICIPHKTIDPVDFPNGTDFNNEYVHKLAILLKHGVDMGSVNLKNMVGGSGNLNQLASKNKQDFLNAGGVETTAPLESGRKVFIEYSNELWLREQLHWVSEKGKTIGFDDGADVYHRYGAWAEIRMWRAFEDVYGTNGDFVKVASGRAANEQGPIGEMFNQVFNVVSNNRNAWNIRPDYWSSDSYINTGHLSGGSGDGASSNVRQEWTNEVNEMVGRVEDLKNYMQSNHGLPLISYEGGQHFNRNAGNFATNPESYDMYLEWISKMSQQFAFVCHYAHYGKWTLNEGAIGSWGAMSYDNQDFNDAHKFRALLDYSYGNASGRMASMKSEIQALEELDEIAVYPNPVENGSIFISVGDNEGLAIVTVLSLDGSVVHRTTFTGAMHTIDRSKFRPGLYLIRVKSDNISYANKLLVK